MDELYMDSNWITNRYYFLQIVWSLQKLQWTVFSPKPWNGDLLIGSLLVGPLSIKTCSIDWVFMTPKFVHQNPNPEDDGIRRWDFWRWLFYEGGALMIGISTLIKDIPESSLTPLPSEVTEGRGPSTDTISAGTLISLRNWESSYFSSEK